MTNVRELTEIQLDALQEVANIGAGHGATALAVMTGRRVMISVPRAAVAALEDVPDLLGDAREVVAAALMRVAGDLTGRMLMVLPEADARQLCDILLHRSDGTTRTFGELESSAVKEVGNILASAYLTALSDFMGMVVLPSSPSLAIDYAGAVLSSAHLGFAQERDFVFYIETEFHFDHQRPPVRGYLLLLPDTHALQVILDTMRLT
jgi:chemotaxis protein CheC